MKDVFYTILIAWIIWKILNSVQTVRNKQTANPNHSTTRKEGETTVDYIPPTKKSTTDIEGEYVDYEEVK